MYYTHVEPNIKTVREMLLRENSEQSRVGGIRGSLFTNVDPAKFLDLPVNDGQTSCLIRDYIYDYYTPDQKMSVGFDSTGITLDSPLNVGTTFWVEDSYLVRDLLFTQTKNVVPTTNTTSFIAEHMNALVSNNGYKKSSVSTSYQKVSNNMQVFMWVRALKPKGSGGESVIDTSETIAPDNDKQGTWVNVTSFITSIDTTVTKSGGNFSFDIAPVMCVYNTDTDSWELERRTMAGNLSSLKTPYYAKTALQSIKDGTLQRNNLFFHQLISENDLVYIRFEELEMERDYSPTNLNVEVSGFDVVSPRYDDDNQLQPIGGNVYDMIGMVDKNGLSLQFNGKLGASIKITGRDLVKAFIDDGTYFFPKEFCSGMFFVSGGTTANNKLLQRNLFNGNVQSVSVYNEKDIQYIFQFLISQLSNTGYVPDDVFEAYGERRNTTVNVDDNVSSSDDGELVKKAMINKLKNDIRVSLISNDNQFTANNVAAGLAAGSGLDYESQDARIQKGTQILTAWVNYMIDTYPSFKETGEIPPYSYDGNEYPMGGQFPVSLLGTILPSLRPKFTEQGNESISINSELKLFETKKPTEQPTEKVDASTTYTANEAQSLNNAVQSLREVLSWGGFGASGFTAKTEYLKGVWQIIDVVIDDNVRNRLLTDNSIAGHTGNIFSALQRVCVEPFAEMLFDTYGDRYCVVIRQQPFDYNGVVNHVTGNGLRYRRGNDKKPVETKRKPMSGLDRLSSGDDVTGLSGDFGASLQQLTMVTDIEEGVIMSENIDWYCGDVFSWYRIVPQAYMFGSQSALTWLFLPAIYFPEYAEVWGSRPWILNSPYIVDKSWQLDSNGAFKKDPLRVQSYYDLKYMIDSTCYLPFTKVGTITIAPGDRRIKRGTWVRRKSSGEIFYVESVQNIGGFGEKMDRRTILTVSHGMVEKYIQPQYDPAHEKPISYFNIIDTTLNFETPGVKTGGAVYDSNANVYAENVLKNFKVNKEVFNFFIQRNQFKS